jgi:hypothetical protein
VDTIADSLNNKFWHSATSKDRCEDFLFTEEGHNGIDTLEK